MLSSPPRAKDMPNRMCHQHTLLYTTLALTSGQTTLSQEQTLRRAEKGRNEEGEKKDSTKPSVLPPNASVMAMLSMPPPMSLLRWNRRGVRTLFFLIIIVGSFYFMTSSDVKTLHK